MLAKFLERFLLGHVRGTMDAGSLKTLDQIPRSRTYPDSAMQRPVAVRKRLDKKPRDPFLWTELGCAWLDIHAVDSARTCFEQALGFSADFAPALAGLAGVVSEQGQVDAAIALYRRVLEVAPADRIAFQNLLFLMLCSHAVTEEEILEWHQRFAARFEAPLQGKIQHVRPTRQDANRRLRIGYVSPDFRAHVVGRCIAPVLARHDREKFAVYCYYNNTIEDDHTATIRNSVDVWLNIHSLDDKQLCKQIQQDRIDILVDLSGHTPGNRLLAFARKPAPLQVSYLDYSATTGFSTIDYRLTDALCDPEPEADRYYTETLWRLPTTYWLYNPPFLHLNNPPRKECRGRLHLACLNSFNRINDTAIQIWAEILQRLPASCLILVGVPEGQARTALLEKFANLGVERGRIELFGFLCYENYIDLVRCTDIALAPFPCNGATTMLDCLWNGVPVVALQNGKIFRSRMGNSILTTLGLDALIARDRREYVEIAVDLAGKRKWREELRATLRDRLKSSVLYQADEFTRAIDSAYRQMWQDYCLKNAAQGAA